MVMAGKNAAWTDAAGVISKSIFDLVSAIPRTKEMRSDQPAERARTLRKKAALKAAAVSGTFALPSGPLGLLTVVPDLLAVWRIQAQMVADISGAFGKTTLLGREQMLYCLFRHAAAQVVRGVGTRVGERVVFHRASLQLLETIARRLGVSVSERVLASSVARWLPLVGSVGVAGYAFYDTVQVGLTAAELFEGEIEAREANGPAHVAAP
jgi:hypothetical protein